MEEARVPKENPVSHWENNANSKQGGLRSDRANSLLNFMLDTSFFLFLFFNGQAIKRWVSLAATLYSKV